MTLLAALTFANAAWLWLALAAAVILVPLAWLALRPAGPQAGARAFGLGLRTLGIALLLLCLLDPQWVSPRPKKGANLFAVLADNSQGLQVADAGETVSRGAKLRTALTAPETPWLEKIADTFQVRPYIFDRDLRRVRDFSELDFQGNSTALGAALKKLRERFTNSSGQQPLAGILLFTDGNATDLPNGLGDTTGLPPVYPVVIGSADGLKDLRIERTDVRQTAFDDAPVSLTVALAGQGAAGRDLAVSVRPLAGTVGAASSDNLPAEQLTRLASDRDAAEVKFDWRPGGTGVQFYETSVTTKNPPALEEATLLNNRRAVLVDRGRSAYRLLFVSGIMASPEFKFFNRALADDPQLELPALIRVAKREPKFSFLGRAGESTNPLFRGFNADDATQRYDQPVLKVVNAKDETELAAGFPRTAAELFAYDAVVLSKVEAAFFSTDQLALLRRFVAERGGGLLLLGGADTLDSGGYQNTPLTGAIPFYLDRKSDVLPQGELTWKLTREGWLEPWTRVRAVEKDERARLDAMPHFPDANALRSIKPGATVLATVTDEAGTVFPSLVGQHYGAGRVAALTIAEMWSWGMHGEAEQADLARFWRQLSRWLVTDVPAPVELRVEPAAEEAGAMTLRVTARDKEFKPLDLATARITVKRVGAEPAKPVTTSAPAAVGTATDRPPATPSTFTQVTLPAEPVVDAPGQFTATFAPREAGAYLAEVEVTDRAGQVLGKAQAGWVHDPAAEEFRSLAPNRTLLEELARRTGGEVITLSGLDSLVKKLELLPAPGMITEEWAQPLWHQGWVFLAVLACFLSEWGWRRWKGLP